MHWVIGDIHGMLRPLRRLLDAVAAEDSSAQLIFAGDYVNRGPDSRGVIDLLLTLTNARFVRGNHDDVLDLILHGTSEAEAVAGADRGMAFQWFMNFGLDSTLLSYGADSAFLAQAIRRPTPARMKQLADLLPSDHRQFIRHLPLVVEEPTFFVTHGRWPALETSDAIADRLQEQPEMRQHVLWGRYPIEEIQAPKRWEKLGLVGHTPVHSYFDDPRHENLVPLQGPSLVLVDTGAALAEWGRLTAYCVEQRRHLQVTSLDERVLK